MCTNIPTAAAVLIAYHKLSDTFGPSRSPQILNDVRWDEGDLKRRGLIS